MPVDYSLLGNPQVASKVIGPAAVAPPSGMQELGQGLTAAVNNYQKATQNTQTIQSNQNVLNSQKQQSLDAAGLRQAASQGVQQAVDYLKKTNPAKAFDLMNKMATYDKTVGDMATTLSTQEKDLPKATQGLAIALGGIVDAATQAEKAKPGSGEQVYQMQMNLLPPAIQQQLRTPDANGHSYAHFDETTNTVLHAGAINALADQQEVKEKKETATQTELADRSALQAKVDAGTATQADKDTLTAYNNKYKLGAATATGSNDKNPFDKNIAASQGKQNTTIEGVAQQTQKLIDDTSTGMNLLKKIPDDYTGPISGRLGLGFENTDVQELDKILSGIPLIQKSATLGQTAGARLFQSELEMMKKSSGSLKLNAPALKWILQEQNQEAQIQKFKNWNIESSNYDNASPTVKTNWLKSHPQPADPRIEIVDPKGVHHTIPYTQLDDYLKATPGAKRW